MNILLNGICGHMGREVAKLCKEGYRSARLVGGVDPLGGAQGDVTVYEKFEDVPSERAVDCIVDFSIHTCTGALLDYAVANRIPAVIATTGHTKKEISDIYTAADSIPVFFSANMSLGVALLVTLAQTTATALPEAEIEIIEKHHNRKLDAPSGTALMLANAIGEVRAEVYPRIGRSGHGKRGQNEIGIHAIRMGSIVGEHEVILATPSQTITLKHEAHSRALYAEGALAAAVFLCRRAPGLYDMNSLVGGEKKENALSGV